MYFSSWFANQLITLFFLLASPPTSAYNLYSYLNYLVIYLASRQFVNRIFQKADGQICLHLTIFKPLRSILCKLLDVIILTKEKGSLCTSDLQYGVKHGSYASLCTAMVQKTISYYVHNG